MTPRWQDTADADMRRASDVSRLCRSLEGDEPRWRIAFEAECRMLERARERLVQAGAFEFVSRSALEAYNPLPPPRERVY